MIASVSMPRRRILFFAVLLIALSAFTFDVVDLREELLILSAPYGSLDNNVTTGVVSDFVAAPEPGLRLLSVQRGPSLHLSFKHLLPCGFRAPPSWS